MQFRRFGRLGFDASVLGFGAMRLPASTVNGTRQVNEQEAIEVIRFAIDHGVNYIDTAWSYGESESVVGKALAGCYREKVKIATKNPGVYVHTREDWFRYLEDQLRRLRTDTIDIYLQHGITGSAFSRWDTFKRLDLWECAMKAKRDGKIRWFGFSFHDGFPLFREVIDSYDWDMVLIQLNYLDRELQAGLKGLRYAASKELPVVIMEPLKGGTLVANVPQEIREEFARFPIQRSPAEWALRWLADLPEVTTVLSGMKSIDEVRENAQALSSVTPNSLTQDELNLVDRVTALWKSRDMVGCTGCYYCMPCPYGVCIPRCFEAYNMTSDDGNGRGNARYYGVTGVRYKKDASQCTQCGACEARCPQGIPIREKLQEMHLALGENALRYA